MSLIELKQLNKYLGPEHNQQHILKDVNLCIEKGEYIAIMGQSGSGKSTLMNLLGGLDQASSGQYLLDGQDLNELDANELSALRLTRFGFVFQRYNLLHGLSALANVALPAIYSNLNVQDRETRASQLLTQLGLGEKLQHLPQEMSGGQQQRVSIARALMNGGEIILADEPTGALDSQSGAMVLEILEHLHQQGHTIILVTHDHTIALRAERMIEIKDGRILSDQRVREQRLDHPILSYSGKGAAGRLSQILEASKMSWHAIWSNKLRSFLTMLGIIIGISSVTMIIAVGNGAKQKMLDDWSGLKDATLAIYPGSATVEPSSSRLNQDDVESLLELPEVKTVSPRISASGTLIYENKNMQGSLQGGDTFTQQYRDIKVEQGRFLTDGDVQQKAQVMVLDPQAAEKLFGKHQKALGKTVLFNQYLYEIVGIGKPQYSGGSGEVWVPTSVLISQKPANAPSEGVTVVIKPGYDSNKVVQKLRQFLIARHALEDFEIYNNDEAMKSYSKSMSNMTFFVSAVAFISLLVGGVGVMNIMLVSVTERIKEIGLRMAVGARRSDIQSQFLIESAVLCLTGGLIGICVAFFGSMVFNLVSTEYKMLFSWSVALAALIFSTVLGLIFGYMPANRAAQLKPIEALAQE